MTYPTVGQLTQGGGGGSLYGGGALPPQAPPAPGATPPGLANLTPEQQQQLMLMMSQGKYQIPPEMIKHAAMTSQQGLETGQLDRSMKLADQLRADAGGQLQGQTVDKGRRYIAPNAANMIASLMGGMYGGQMAGGVEDRRKKMVTEGQTAAEGIMNAVNSGR